MYVEIVERVGVFSMSNLALALDMTMKEIDQNGHEDERMVLVFNAFDQILPQLGVFSPLAGKLRNEFFGNFALLCSKTFLFLGSRFYLQQSIHR